MLAGASARARARVGQNFAHSVNARATLSGQWSCSNIEGCVQALHQGITINKKRDPLEEIR